MKTTELVKDRWQGVLLALGVDGKFLTGKHIDCPICKSGKDKFRFDNKEGRGTFYCNDCGAGDGWKLLRLIHGWDFRTAANKVDGVIGRVRKTNFNLAVGAEKRQQRLDRIATRIRPVNSSVKVLQYLSRRGFSHKTIKALSDDVGFVQNLEYWENGRVVGRYEALVSAVRYKGKVITYHLTYLENGFKANVEAPRKYLPPIRSLAGSAVQAMPLSSGVVGIAEGIESALAAYEIFNIPTWAATNANNLDSFDIPSRTEKLIIFSDNDKNFVGQKSAYSLAWKCAKKGLKVDVMVPPEKNTDWCDYVFGTIIEAR